MNLETAINSFDVIHHDLQKHNSEFKTILDKINPDLQTFTSIKDEPETPEPVGMIENLYSLVAKLQTEVAEYESYKKRLYKIIFEQDSPLPL